MADELKIVLGIDDQDIKKIEAGIQARGGAGARGDITKGTERAQEATSGFGKALSGVVGVVGKIVAFAGPIIILGQVFSQMAQVSGPFIAAMNRMRIFTIKAAQILGEALAPIIDIVVTVLESMMPLLRSFANFMKLINPLLKVFAVTIIETMRSIAEKAALTIADISDAFVQRFGIGAGPKGYHREHIKRLFDESDTQKIRGKITPGVSPTKVGKTTEEEGRENGEKERKRDDEQKIGLLNGINDGVEQLTKALSKKQFEAFQTTIQIT